MKILSFDFPKNNTNVLSQVLGLSTKMLLTNQITGFLKV